MKQKTKPVNRESQSFVLHENIIRMSEQLSDIDLAHLYRHIYAYVEKNEEPQGETSLVVSVIFKEWQLRYLADKAQYELVCMKRAEAGRKGMEKRWHAGQTDEADGTTTADTDTTAQLANHNTTISKISDNDSDSEFDSDSDSDHDAYAMKKETSPSGEAKKKVSLNPSHSIEERLKAFYHSIEPFCTQYDPEMLNDFYQYWTELDQRRQRMRFELQKTWETSKRLSLWSRKKFC